jgi:hypothetical protein
MSHLSWDFLFRIPAHFCAASIAPTMKMLLWSTQWCSSSILAQSNMFQNGALNNPRESINFPPVANFAQQMARSASKTFYRHCTNNSPRPTRSTESSTRVSGSPRMKVPGNPPWGNAREIEQPTQCFFWRCRLPRRWSRQTRLSYAHRPPRTSAHKAGSR